MFPPLQRAATMATENKSKVQLKLLIDKKAQRVIFAEAGKDFVDFLFNLLRLPIGGAVRLLTSASETTDGSVSNVYQSLQALDQSYLQPGLNKKSLLDLCAAPVSPSLGASPLWPADAFPSKKAGPFYGCSSVSHSYVSGSKGTKCPSCSNSMDRQLALVSSPEGDGYVKDMVTYMVMDDLTVTPATMISTIALLNAASVKEFEALEAKVVEFGVDEGIKLLEASLWSKAVLTSVFLGKKEADGDAGQDDRKPAVEIEILKNLKQ